MGRASAKKLVDIRTKQAPPEKNPAAVALGRLGGLKGGKARADKLTQEQRIEIAQRAAKQRWARKKGVPQEPATDQEADSGTAAKATV